MRDKEELKKFLGDEEILKYSKTYYLISEYLFFLGSSKKLPHYTKVRWLKTKDGDFHFLATLIHQWGVEFQEAHHGHQWNGDYIQAIWDYVDMKLEQTTKEK